MTAPLLSVNGLTLTVPPAEPKGGRRTIVDDISFDIAAGEALGLVGESGSGKSMTARAVMKLLASGVEASGSITFDGEDVLQIGNDALRRLRSSRIAMVFQDPRAHINPVRSVGDFLVEGLCAKGMARTEARERTIGLLAEVGIDDGERRFAQYPHELSGGLLQRVMIAAAMAIEPELLLADEPTTALDVTTQSEVMAILEDLRRDRGLAMLFITHDLELAAATCDRTAVMYAGRIVEVQASAALQADPRHPYTSGLMSSRPDIDVVHDRLPVITGQPIAAFESDDGCSFAPRCPHRQPRCEESAPPLGMNNGVLVACHRADDLRGHLDHDEVAS